MVLEVTNAYNIITKPVYLNLVLSLWMHDMCRCSDTVQYITLGLEDRFHRRQTSEHNFVLKSLPTQQ